MTMEELYALYLKLAALTHAGASEDFATALNTALQNVTLTRSIEINATAALATVVWVASGEEEEPSLLNFFEFQQEWQKYRDTSTR